MTVHHDYHMARLRIARLEQALGQSAHRLDMHAAMVESPPMRARIYDWADEARAALETKKDPAQDEGSGRG